MTLDIKQEAESFFQGCGAHPRIFDKYTFENLVSFAAHILDKATGWRPIADAPKDGSRILIYSPNASRAVREVSWSIPYEGATDGWWATPHGPQGRGYTILPESPTHWQPLPPPPEAA